MAIYSLSRRPITKALKACYLCVRPDGTREADCDRCGGDGRYRRFRPGFAAAHARYVLRDGACSEVVALLPPMVEPNRRSIARWMHAAEKYDRKNARVCDRVMVAVPRELDDHAARVEVVREFCDRVSGRKIPYFAGMHDLAGDEDNPHAHCVFRDRGLLSGRPVVGLGELGSTEWIREQWEASVNDALSRGGFYETIDRRSYARRGMWDAVPTKHLGPRLAPLLQASRERLPPAPGSAG